MSDSFMHIHCCMFYEFQLRSSASAAACHIYAAVGVADRACRDWFNRFCKGDMSLEGRPKSEHPLQSDIEQIKVLIEDNPLLITRELSVMLGCD